MDELEETSHEWQHLGDVAQLAGARAAVLVRERLFVAGADGVLWRAGVDAEEVGACEALGEGGWNTRVLAAARGRVLAFEENGHLYGIDPESGAWDRLDGDWSNVRAACTVADQLFAAAGNLYGVDPEEGSWRQLGDAQFSSRILAGDEASLYSLEDNGSLYRVDPADGTWEQLDGDWGDVSAAGGRTGGLFLATEGGSLYALGRGGVYAPLEDGAPRGLRFLFARPSGLLGLGPDGALFALPLG